MTNEVLFEENGHLGIITLNRPHALNALTLTMIKSMQKQLALWKSNPSIHAVVLNATPANAFCAGGDVRWLYAAGQAHDPAQLHFFWHEYRLNHYIHHFGKPYIALMDGITMGGGVGVSMHGSHRVATEHFAFSMPETAIGFFPDIGASYLLHQCPGALGLYLALTGNRLGAQDSKKVGLVDEVVACDKIAQLIPALLKEDLSANAHERVNACIRQFASYDSADKASHIHPLIDECFARVSVDTIIQALENSEGSWAIAVDHSLCKKSPLSLKVTFEQMRRTKGLSLAECLKMDYDLVRHFMRNPNFYEGVRAALIDKDQSPQWTPSRLDRVDEYTVVSYFESISPELEFIT